MVHVAEETKPELHVFEKLESEVRSYCRSFPTVFTKARNDKMWDRGGREYIDFFAGAGTLNYGHNNPKIKEKLIEYLMNDGITHSLDMATEAKERLLEKFNSTILKPRGMEYKVMFPGPTGANSVESALKLARKKTGRQTVMSFTNAFHGMTLGALAVTGNKFKRQGAGVPLHHSVLMPFDRYYGEEVDTVEYIERYLEDSGSGVSLPAAIILETVQGEGGINVASVEWLRKIEQICRRYNILLIVDDIQAGCGRTGTFFSFEEAGIKPDIICLSKAIGGFGLPFALTLFRSGLDIWEPGEHNGTFRGNNLAFIAASEALDYWENNRLEKDVKAMGERVSQRLDDIVRSHPSLQAERRGRGLFQGIAFPEQGMAEEVCAEAFQRGLVMETSGPESEVAKVMPALTIGKEALEQGLDIFRDSVAAVAKRYSI
ncbi:diaminobutyrate--2-oxoglutarate transaminase [Paenibacillus sp. J2TS4]|uniref:diaminobutyrate--2-oxoglutarate transaminase n=1 Tax=Paenibacillus sp. J2TS4 TaxID=2807194 RepID=UPI001B1E29B4|nr:diaminobutyrate--2-oxoglutarate transaminase [Paenibacillus sp. J2TS4]GIP33171.1 diaminobutyrate--2-oxoglutarate transaminase [Paenibacillus sp. J2TS4]